MLTMIAFTALFTGCEGDENRAENMAEELLEQAYESALEGNAAQALTYANLSLQSERTAGALQFKSQMQYVLNDKTAAYDTLQH